MRVRKHTLVVAAIGLLALTACSATSTDALPSSAESASSATGGSASSVPAISSIDLSRPIDHVHGLVATGPGQLVAGTHSGAMRVRADGSVSAQGEQRDDLMGMTGVTDTDRLVSSGHPGAESEFPNPMGLLTSSDAGKTWSAVSLQGDVDFHAMAISGQDVVGYSGGSNLVISSDGGKTWTDGAALQVAALAYTADQVLATTQAGLQASTDGGKTFKDLPRAPALVLISAGKNAAMLGVDASGNAWRSDDSGASWTDLGQVGQIQAVAAYDNTIGYAISENRLVVIR